MFKPLGGFEIRSLASSKTSLELLFSRATQVKLVLLALGSLLVSLLEVLGVLAIVVLVQLVSGADLTSIPGPIAALLLGLPEAQRVSWVALLVIAIFVVKALVSLGFQWWRSGFLGQEEARTSVRLLRYYLRAPWALHLQRSTSDFINSINTAVAVSFSTTVSGAITIATATATVLALVVVLALAAPWLTLAALAYFLVSSLGLAALTRRAAERAGRDSLSASREQFGAAIEAIAGAKEIRLRDSAGFYADRYYRARAQAVRANRITQFLQGLPRYALEVLFIVGLAGMAVALIASASPQEAFSQLALFAAAGTRILPSITQLIANLNALRSGRASWSLLLRELRAADSQQVAVAPRQGDLVPRHQVTVSEVSFRYPGSDHDVLQQLNLEIPVGSSVALVGTSGAGKSTLVDLLLGLHAPTSGVIRCDEVNIADRMPDWQVNLAVVPQDVMIMHRSLAQNIAFDQADEDIEHDLLHDCIVKAQLRDFVAGLPAGLDTELGEHGIRASGGQRQRIGIARALYRRPAVLFLDEATSALDNETESQITNTIESLKGSLTQIVVAHRLSTVRHCESIVFLADGQVEAQGSFEEVQAKSPAFARLVELGRLDPPVSP